MDSISILATPQACIRNPFACLLSAACCLLWPLKLPDPDILASEQKQIISIMSELKSTTTQLHVDVLRIVQRGPWVSQKVSSCWHHSHTHWLCQLHFLFTYTTCLVKIVRCIILYCCSSQIISTLLPGAGPASMQRRYKVCKGYMHHRALVLHCVKHMSAYYSECVLGLYKYKV